MTRRIKPPACRECGKAFGMPVDLDYVHAALVDILDRMQKIDADGELGEPPANVRDPHLWRREQQHDRLMTQAGFTRSALDLLVDRVDGYCPQCSPRSNKRRAELQREIDELTRKQAERK